MIKHPPILSLLALGVILVVAGPRPLTAQAIVGQVIDHASGDPLDGVHVRLVDEDGREHASTYAADDGRFRIAAPRAGQWRIHAALVGYASVESRPMELDYDQTMVVEILMGVDPVPIDEPIVVTAERSYINADIEDFHRRRREGSGNGTFIHGEDVRRRLGARPTDLIRTIPGVTLMRTPQGQDQIIHMRAGCIPAVFIDGMQINRYNPTESIDTYLDVQSIEGIEVYRGSQPGGRFYDRRGCGLVLVWTRRGDIDAGGSFSWARLFVALGIFVAIVGLR